MEITQQEQEKFNKIKEFKTEIKILAATQKIVKGQRKTVNIQVERTIDPWKATSQAANNKYVLRHMYVAYGHLRGKTQAQVERKSLMPINLDFIAKLLEKYGEKTVLYNEK